MGPFPCSIVLSRFQGLARVRGVVPRAIKTRKTCFVDLSTMATGHVHAGRRGLVVRAGSGPVADSRAPLRCSASSASSGNRPRLLRIGAF